MLTKDKLFQIGDTERIWQKYCGFLDLSLGEFMEIQEHLLLDEIELVTDSPLGKKIMNNQRPASIEEFRRLVPLTTYNDYEPYLSEQREEVLAEKPMFWCHTAGRQGFFKWVPYTERHYRRVVDTAVSGLILCCATRKGEVNLKGGEKIVYTVAPRPYGSWFMARGIGEQLGLRFLPSLDFAEQVDFQQRIEESFRLALEKGVDIVGSITSVLVKIGEKFTEQAGGLKFSTSMLHPAVLFRLGKALLSSKLQGQPMLPKNLWHVKGILCAGTDTAIYRDQVIYYWGTTPWELYGPTEAGILAMQSWNKKAMTFTPYSSFLEFIPEEEWLKTRDDPEYQPFTVLLNEVKQGECYEVVTSSFYGLPLLRYRPGDLIKIVSLRDEETGINLPHMTFKCRTDELIDLGGITRLDEKTIWQAIVNTGVKYEDWSARKEYDQNQAYLRIYLELKESREPQELEQMIDSQLKAIDAVYRDIDTWLELQPVRVTPLSPGTFQRFYQEKQKEGVDLAHLKPSHMNASDMVVQRLKDLSGVGSEE